MGSGRLPGRGLATLALGLVTALVPGTVAAPARDAAAVTAARPWAARPSARPASARPGAAGAGAAGAETGAGAAGASLTSGPCAAFPGARQLPGADGVAPAAWSGGGLTVPACGPEPGDEASAPVYPYPGALWTSGYQCVEFSERYLYDRYGVTMGIATNGDQVAAHYAAGYPGLFMIIRNGTSHRAPAAGDVLSFSAAPGFDSPSGGHTAVVQSSSVDEAGNGTVTIVEQNATASGVAVLPVAGWTVRYPGFRYVEWLATAGLTVTSPHPPPLRAGQRYSFALTATGGRAPYRWQVTDGSLPPGLRLSPAGPLTGTVTGPAGRWPVTVAVTDARGATAIAALSLTVPDLPPA